MHQKPQLIQGQLWSQDDPVELFYLEESRHWYIPGCKLCLERACCFSSATTIPRDGINRGSSAARTPRSRRDGVSALRRLLTAIVKSSQRGHRHTMIAECLV